jgi:hypothetical protein
MAIEIFTDNNTSSGVTAIKSFPYTSDPDDLGSRILNEDNITNIIKCICNSDTFVIKKEDTILEFVIKGYYFKIDTSNLENGNSGSLYAGIIVNEPTTESITGDDPTTPTTISYGSTLQKLIIKDTYFNNCLQLLDNDGNIPENSKIKFDIQSLAESFTIDCGRISY